MNGHNACILIVDDELTNIQVLQFALKAEYDIDIATGGQEALIKAKRKVPDLILLDVMMPDLSGFEVCQILKSDEQLAHIPILFLTAMDTIEDELKGLKAGAIDYLSKPLNIELLQQRVRNHVALKKSGDIIMEQRNRLISQNEELEVALTRIRRLEGIIPICMYCKKIRDDQDGWTQLEEYISEHSEARFSHGICPHCVAEQMKMINP